MPNRILKQFTFMTEFRPGLGVIIGVWLAVGFASTASGQTGRPAKLASSTQRQGAVKSLPEDQQRTRISQIIVQARTAKSIDDYTQSLIRCQQIYRQGLTDENRQYLRQLIAWLYVRRGEKQADEAANWADKQDEEQAQKFEKRALQDFEHSINASPTWRAFHNRGISHAMLGDFESALSDFNEAIERNTKPFASSYFNRGEIHFELADYEQAERDYDEAYRIDPTDQSSLVGRAHARYQAGKTDDALRDFDEILRLNPDDAAALADRADVHAFLRDWEKAAADYQKAIKLDKTLGRAYQSVAWMMSTCPDERFRHPEFALRAAKKAIELNGDEDYRYLDTLAAAEANASHFDQATAAMQRAIVKAPDELQNDLKERLALYQTKKAYRDER